MYIYVYVYAYAYVYVYVLFHYYLLKKPQQGWLGVWLNMLGFLMTDSH